MSKVPEGVSLWFVGLLFVLYMLSFCMLCLPTYAT